MEVLRLILGYTLELSISYHLVFLFHVVTVKNDPKDRLFVNANPMTYYNCLNRLYAFQKLFKKRFKALSNVLGHCNEVSLKSKRKYTYFSSSIERAFKTEIAKEIKNPRKVAWKMMDWPTRLLICLNFLNAFAIMMISWLGLKDLNVFTFVIIGIFILPLGFLISVALQGMLFQVSELFFHSFKVDRYYLSKTIFLMYMIRSDHKVKGMPFVENVSKRY